MKCVRSCATGADEGQGAGTGRRPGSRQLPVDDASREEAQEFLRWAADNHFTFFGYREYRVEKQGKEEVLAPLNDTGLGLMRGKDKSAARPVKTLAAQGLNTTSGLKDALILTKTNARSRVHRAGYMDYIGVLEFDAKGKIIGERSACSPPAPTTVARGKSRWCASATST